MRYPQLVLCEKEPGLREMLRELADTHQWIFRPRHQPASCLRLLRRSNPTVLVLRLAGFLTDKSLEREFKLLERAAWSFPDTRIVVVSDVENAALAALAWDLGASCVLTTPEARDQLVEIVGGMMKAAIRD